MLNTDVGRRITFNRVTEFIEHELRHYSDFLRFRANPLGQDVID